MQVLDPPTTVEAPATQRTTTTAGRTVAVVIGTLLVGTLLCADRVHRAAERMDYGTARDVALAFAEPVRDLSHAVWLDRPEDWLSSWLGRDARTAEPVLSAAVRIPAPTSMPTTFPGAVGAEAGAAVAPTIPAATAPPTPTLPPRRVPSPEQPLRVWFGGDSVGGAISEGFARLVGGDGRYDIRTDVQVSTGLARTDVFDWGAELQARMAADDPEVVFLTFGANDDQPMFLADGTHLPLGSGEWAAEYARRVGLMMDIASEGGKRTVVWLALPAVRPEQLEGVRHQMNEAARLAAAPRVDVVFIATGGLFDAPGGSYQDEVALPDGTTVRARQDDGVHVSHDGASLLAPFLLEAILDRWHLR